MFKFSKLELHQIFCAQLSVKLINNNFLCGVFLNDKWPLHFECLGDTLEILVCLLLI
jgi:hypothetical protein